MENLKKKTVIANFPLNNRENRPKNERLQIGFKAAALLSFHYFSSSLQAGHRVLLCDPWMTRYLLIRQTQKAIGTILGKDIYCRRRIVSSCRW